MFNFYGKKIKPINKVLSSLEPIDFYLNKDSNVKNLYNKYTVNDFQDFIKLTPTRYSQLAEGQAFDSYYSWLIEGIPCDVSIMIDEVKKYNVTLGEFIDIIGDSVFNSHFIKFLVDNKYKPKDEDRSDLLIKYLNQLKSDILSSKKDFSNSELIKAIDIIKSEVL